MSTFQKVKKKVCLVNKDINWEIRLETDLQKLLSVSKYFRVTLLHQQRLVAVCWLTDDPLLLDVGGVLTHGVVSTESEIFESSRFSPYLGLGWRLSLFSRHSTVLFPAIYDSSLATPCVRTTPTSRSRGSSVSQHSLTNRWWRVRLLWNIRN